MTFAPLISATLPIQLHVVCVTIALVLGPFALLRRSRDRWHRRIGALWVAAMAMGALTSFLITEYGLIGPFSPIHALSVLVLWSLWSAIAAIRRGDVAKHRATMQALYVYALLVPGLFTLVPGRMLHAVIFGAPNPLGFAAVVLGALGLALAWQYTKQRGV